MVGEKFKAIRKAKGLTLEGATKMLGIKSSGHLSMVERGDREPSDALVNNFKLTFSVSETWWETGEGEMFQAPDIEGLKMKNLADKNLQNQYSSGLRTQTLRPLFFFEAHLRRDR